MCCHTSDLLCDARKETIKCTIKSVANASQGVTPPEVTFPMNHCSWTVPHGLWRCSAVGCLPCSFPTFPCRVGVSVGRGIEKMQGSTPSVTLQVRRDLSLPFCQSHLGSNACLSSSSFRDSKLPRNNRTHCFSDF